MTGRHGIPRDVGIELLHALVVAAAHVAATRILVIKGPTLARQGLRPARLSADVDVLVPPLEVERVVAVLSRWGWHPRITEAALQPSHSITLIHAEWGADIDLHREFPGIGRDASTAFERLWRDHHEERFAGVLVPVPSPNANAVILALHAARDRAEVGGAEGIRVAAEAVARRPSADILDLVGALDAAVAFDEVAIAAGIVNPDPAAMDPLRSRAWRVATSTRDRTGPLLATVLAAPLRERPRLIAQAVWPSETVIRAENPGLAPGHLAVVRRRFIRIATGLRSLPAAISALRRRRTSP